MRLLGKASPGSTTRIRRASGRCTVNEWPSLLWCRTKHRTVSISSIDWPGSGCFNRTFKRSFRFFCFELVLLSDFCPCVLSVWSSPNSVDHSADVLLFNSLRFDHVTMILRLDIHGECPMTCKTSSFNLFAIDSSGVSLFYRHVY